VVSILDAVFTVSPKSWNLALSPLNTPAVTGPEFRPILKGGKQLLAAQVSSAIKVASKG
jgi:hypothetical protein